MKIIFLTLTLILTGACHSASHQSNSTNNSAAQTNASSAKSLESSEFAVGDTVLHHSKSGQRFYEAKITSLEGKNARLTYNNETVESDVSDIYRLPKADQATDVKAGDVVAARFGQTAVWAGAEIVKTDGDKITVKWLSTGQNAEVSAASILPLPPATQARVKKAFQT